MAEYIPEHDLRQRARAALSKAKEQSGLKQEALGRRLGVTQATISKALSENTSQPYATLLAKIIAEFEQKTYLGPYHRFSEVSEGSILVQCQSRTVDDLIFYPDGKDAVLIKYPFVVQIKRGSYLKDLVSHITIHVYFSGTLFAMLGNRGLGTLQVIKLAYVDAFHNLLAQLQTSTESNSVEITLYSNNVDQLMEIDPYKVNIKKIHVIDLEVLQQKWEKTKPQRPFGFQLV